MLGGFLFMMIIANALLFRLAGKHAFPLFSGFLLPRFIGLFVTSHKMSSSSDLQLFKKKLHLFLYFAGLSLVSSGDSLAASRHWNYWKGRLGVPYFSNDTKTKVLATLGHTTYLHCVVGNLGDRQVSKIN